MGFEPISIDDYIKLYIENNPGEDENDLRERLYKALMDHKNGLKCKCGSSIWVIGSASVGNSCFSCITGEDYPMDDYEIDSALVEVEEEIEEQSYELPPLDIHGFYNDDGTNVNIDLIKKPSLCMTCKHDNNPHKEILCILTRCDQNDNEEFICFDYQNIYS